MGTMVVMGATIILVGLWYQNEEAKQRAFEYIQMVQERDSDRTETVAEPEGSDPFGLFGPEEAVYEMTIRTYWTQETHEEYFVSNAHFSDPVIWVADTNPVFTIGDAASAGMEEMAEEGLTRELKDELEELTTQDAIQEFHILDRLEAQDEVTQRVNVDRDHSVVSLVSMIAPSPDWFVAIEGVNLLEDGRWREEFTLQTIALDAGTEDGVALSIDNEATQPQGVISALTDMPSASYPPFMQVTFTQVGYQEN